MSRRTCARKLRYDDLAKAESQARIFLQRVYKCPACEGYHLTKWAQDKTPEELAREAEAKRMERVKEDSERDALARIRRLRQSGKRRRA